MKLTELRKLICEVIEEESMQQFATNRLKGATDITNNAKEKGGDALLTYHHFKVKLPYYEQETKGELDMGTAKTELNSLAEELYSAIKGDINIEQIHFQELVGTIEVLGELLIRSKEEANGIKETSNPESGKAAPYGSGYAPIQNKNN
jgi:hypothetical protein